jgi:hypothetical protein
MEECWKGHAEISRLLDVHLITKHFYYILKIVINWGGLPSSIVIGRALAIVAEVRETIGVRSQLAEQYICF